MTSFLHVCGGSSVLERSFSRIASFSPHTWRWLLHSQADLQERLLCSTYVEVTLEKKSPTEIKGTLLHESGGDSESWGTFVKIILWTHAFTFLHAGGGDSVHTILARDAESLFSTKVEGTGVCGPCLQYLIHWVLPWMTNSFAGVLFFVWFYLHN